MPNILEVTSQDVRSLSGDGTRFTIFVDDLITGLAALNGVPRSAVLTNQRVNQRDGGVDTEVRRSMSFDPYGFSGSNASWQYKATGHSGVSDADLKEEVHKPYSTALIQQGFAYRLAIADDLPAGKQQAWTALLTAEVQSISPSAPPAMVASASQLASWATAFPGVRAKHFGVPGGGRFLHLDAWRQYAEQHTETFVPIPGWSGVQSSIESHVEFATTPPRAVLCVSGAAGVGKTRLVFETLRGVQGAAGLVLYTADEAAAIQLAYDLASLKELRCVLVADECLFDARNELENILRGVRDRVRVVAIDNSGVRPGPAAIQVTVPPMERSNLESVLSSNYATVSGDRRARYAEVSEGFVRVAAELCTDDPLLGDASALSGGLESYVYGRLTEDDRKALEALSLVWRIGWRDRAADELAALASIVGIDVATLKERLRGMKDRPGFVKDAGRYMYVTPQSVARVVFRWAWARLAQDDPPSFLASVPDELTDSFIKRANFDGDEEVRREVAAYFRETVAALTAKDLADPELARRVALLVETMPADLLPSLERVVTDAAKDDLSLVSGRSVSGWGGRRHLVWLLERLAWLPEHFGTVERMLAALAVAESEPAISNNATGIYCQAARIYLSGTPVPFLERAVHLRHRLENGTPEDRRLVVEALEGSLSPFGHRMGAPNQVAGRVPGEDWQPRTHGELRKSMAEVLSLLALAAGDKDEDVAGAALNALASNVRRLVHDGLLNEVRETLSSAPGLQQVVPEVLSQLEAFLRYDVPEDLEEAGKQYVADVRAWAGGLTDESIEGRLLRLVGRWPRDSTEDEDAISELQALAADLVAQPAELEKHLPWLSSEKARNANNLGVALAANDSGQWLDRVLDAAAKTGATGLARGYCHGLAKQPTAAAALEAALDGLEASSPLLVYELSMIAERATKTVERVRRLAIRRAVPPSILVAPGLWTRGRDLNLAESGTLLQDIVRQLNEGGSQLRAGAVRLVGHWLRYEDTRHLIEGSAENVAAAWEILQHAADEDGGDAYWWARAITRLAKLDAPRAAKVASRGLVGKSVTHNREAANVLSSLAAEHPVEVMNSLGAVMMDPDKGWRFRVGSLRGLIVSIPVDVTKSWLETHGVAGARQIARHLPSPSASPDGTAQLHPLTEFVLTEFEDDDETFGEFQAGTHSMQMYMGDIAGQHQAEADAARPLLSHPLRRVREWAEREVRYGEARAKEWREREAERDVDF